MEFLCGPFQGSQQNRVNDKEAHIFWIALVLAPLVWCIFFITALFTFQPKWLVRCYRVVNLRNYCTLYVLFQLLVTIALMLTGANLYGYIKCKIGNTESLSSATSSFLRQQVLQNAVSLVAGQSKTPQSNPVSSPLNTV